MSRSNPTPTNPAKRFFTWKGGTGKLVYWDKEKSEEVEIKLPFTFLVLDQLATITGYSDHDQSGYWSNEVRSVAREELTVRTSHGTKEVGLYRDIKGSIGITGAKYAKSIYLAYVEDDEMVIGNLKAAGAALTSWIEFSNTCAVGNGKVILTGSTEAKKGATKYFVPTFEWEHSETEEDEKAVALDKELQVYLSQYLAANHVEHVQEDVEDVEDTPDDSPKRTAKQLDKDEDEEIKSLVASGDVLDGEEIDINQIPF